MLTDYLSGTSALSQHFFSRNRIVAGLSDATIVVESANKGGSLIAADIANSYNMEVFAVPGNQYWYTGLGFELGVLKSGKCPFESGF